jgi:hypothetical protein
MKQKFEWLGTRGEIVGVCVFERPGETVELDPGFAQGLIADGFPLRALVEPETPAEENV